METTETVPSEVAKDDSVQTTETPAGDRVWDLLTEFHKNLVAYSAAPAIVTHLSDPEIVAKIPNKPLVSQAAQMLARDVKDYATSLSEIRQQHADRIGSSLNIDDSLEAIQIHEQYLEWSNSYESVVVPSVRVIAEQLSLAGAQLTEQANSPVSTIINQHSGPIDPDLSAASFEEENNG